MSDLREQMARRFYELQRLAEGEWSDWDELSENRYDRESGWPKNHWREMADSAIAVVIEELAQRAENQSRNITTNHKHEEGDYVTFGPLGNWLRAQE